MDVMEGVVEDLVDVEVMQIFLDVEVVADMVAMEVMEVHFHIPIHLVLEVVEEEDMEKEQMGVIIKEVVEVILLLVEVVPMIVMMVVWEAVEVDMALEVMEVDKPVVLLLEEVKVHL